MHGGLRKAFALHAKGFALKNGYVDLKPMATGCDTIFLLSDGAPSSDDFRIKDRDYFDVKVVHELEQKRAASRRPDTINYHGPMDQKYWMVNEVRRFNAFRKVQVHCIGVGDADIDLLRKIAKATDGQVYLFGAIAKAAGKQR